MMASIGTIKHRSVAGIVKHGRDDCDVRKMRAARARMIAHQHISALDVIAQMRDLETHSFLHCAKMYLRHEC